MVQSAPKPASDLLDWDELKERIRDAIRGAIQECADERGLSFHEFLDWYCRERCR